MQLRRILRWLVIGVGGLVAIAVLGVVAIYVLVGVELDQTFDIPTTELHVASDEATIAEGERLARIRGCNGGCHGKTVNGNVFFEVPDGTVIVAPDLGRVAQEYSVGELERLIRHGVRPDGTSVILPMPSTMFCNLSDEDLGAIIAFLKAQPPGDENLPSTSAGPLGRLMFFYYGSITGSILAAELIDHDAPRISPVSDDPSERGRYLAMTACTECHGDDLQGGADGFAPTLAIVAAYSLDDFRKLMRTGEPVGGRKLDLMATVARSRFAHFSDAEITDIHGYLQGLASTLTASQADR